MSFILNNYVLDLIFNELNVKQLLRLERVSQQLMDCVGSALQRKNGLAIGEINWNVVCEEKTQSLSDGDLDGFKARIETILKRCPNITSLYLNKCLHEWYGLRSIANYCPKLECLTIMDTNGSLYTEEEWTSLAQRLSTQALKHLTINYIEVMAIDCDKWLNWTTILLHKCWKTLRKLTLYEYNEPLNDILNWLPQNIKQLNLSKCHGFDKTCLNSLISFAMFAQLDELYLDFDETFDEASDETSDETSDESFDETFDETFDVTLIETIFTVINDNIILNAFTFKCNSLSMKALNTIVRQKQLKKFKFISNDEICINAINWHQMPEMRSLELSNVYFNLNYGKNLSKCLPQNLNHFYCGNIDYVCKCESMPDKCGKCYLRFCQAYLPQLSRWSPKCNQLYVEYLYEKHHLVFNYLHLYNNLKCFEVRYQPEVNDLDLVNKTIKYIIKTVVYKIIKLNVLTNCFTLTLCKPIYNEVIRQLNDEGICIPSNYTIVCIDCE